MVSVVSQMLCQDLDISDPHNIAATFYLRGLLNTSILRSTPNNTSYPEGSLQLWASSISAVVYVLHREKPSWGVHSICGPWPRNSNLVTVEQGTFHHSSTLPAISMDFQKIKKKPKAIDTISQIVQPWPARGGSNRTPPRAQASSSQPIVNRFLGTISINSSQSTHSLSQIIICITYYPSIPVPKTGTPCNQPPRGTRSDEVKKCQEQLNLPPPRKSMKVKKKINKKINK